MSLTYKGVSSDTYSYFTIKNVKYSILPPSNVSTVSVAGRAGSYFIRKEHGVGRIEVEFAIKADSLTDFKTKKRAIADWLDADKPEAFVESDEPDKTYYAIVEGDTPLSQILSLGQGTIKFICPDPYAYGTLQTKTLNTGSNSVTYNGTVEAFPKMTVTFASAQTYFEVSNGTQKVHIDASLATTSTLVIDFSTGKITINNVLNMQTLTLDSDFFPLVKGTNTLTVSGGTVSLTYNERFK